MLGKICSYIAQLKNNILELFTISEINRDEDGIGEPIPNLDSLLQAREITSLVSELVEVAGITMEQFDSGKDHFE